MKVKIRHAKTVDAEGILRIHRQALEDGNAFVQESIEFKGTIEGKQQQIDRAADSKTSCFFVAEAEQTIVGWISLSGYEFKKLNHVAMLGTAVERQHRNQGIGLDLVKAAIEWAKCHSHLRRLALAVFDTNRPAIAIYKKAGFKIEGVERNEIRFPDGTFCHQTIMGLVW